MTARRKSVPSSHHFEKSLQRLEAIVRQLEDEQICLEKALKLFTEGQILARQCAAQLHEAENQVRLLIENSKGDIVENDFTTTRADSPQDTQDTGKTPTDDES